MHAIRLMLTEREVMRIIQNTMLLLAVCITAGCTSMGHEARAVPSLSLQMKEVPKNVTLSGNTGELSVAVEQLLKRHGIEVMNRTDRGVKELQGEKEYSTVESPPRYKIDVRSVDLDVCVPEGSRQMNFAIVVDDMKDRKRIFVMGGDFGCKNTILAQFEKWLPK